MMRVPGRSTISSIIIVLAVFSVYLGFDFCGSGFNPCSVELGPGYERFIESVKALERVSSQHK